MGFQKKDLDLRVMTELVSSKYKGRYTSSKSSGAGIEEMKENHDFEVLIRNFVLLERIPDYNPPVFI